MQDIKETVEGLVARVDHIQEQFRSMQKLLFNRLERLEELPKTCHMRPGEKPYQQGYWEPAYTSMQEQRSRSTCWEQPSFPSPWEQPSCSTSWEQPSFPTSWEQVSRTPWEQNSRSGPWEQHSRSAPWEQPSRSIPREHPSEQPWSDSHESIEFQSPGTQNTAKTPLHKCPPLVVTSKVSSKALPSSVINRDADELLPADIVIGKYPKLRKPSKIPTLGVKLALESFFGRSVLVRCTPKGCRDLPGLPTAELGRLKQSLFDLMPQFWATPSEFEVVWMRCEECIGQACKRLRQRHPLNPFNCN